MDISVVIPLYNEDESLTELYEWIARVMDENHISYQSPIGQALLGKSVDSSVAVRTPKGMRHITICEVEYK